MKSRARSLQEDRATGFHYFSVRQYENAIGAENRRQAVADDQHCSHPSEPFERVLNQILGLAVDRFRCFIK